MRIGLAGYGRGGRFFHAPLIGLAPECTLAGVLTRSPRRRAELADDFPGLPVAGTLGELAAAGIDAVVISTPLDTHEALVREAIALGLPVVCDKPFTPDAASALTLVKEAERRASCSPSTRTGAGTRISAPSARSWTRARSAR